MKRLLLFIVLCSLAPTLQAQDWANYSFYAKANASLEKAPRVVFMGNSITQGWARLHPEFFADHNFAGRGISGQVTAQMLARFRADVIDLNPEAVVILAGTNDIAQNQGPVAVEHIAQNIVSMAELAKAAGIKVYILSVLPAKEYGWRRSVTNVVEKIKTLNTLLKNYAAKNKCTYVDLYTPMVDAEGGLDAAYTNDGVHPTAAGYEVMERHLLPLLRKYIR